MKKIFTLLFIVIFMCGCSNKELSQLSPDEISGMAPEDQARAIIDNTKLIDEYSLIIENDSVAVVYPAAYISDERLVSGNDDDSFPNVAMTTIEHLSVLGFGEIVITSYDPKDVEGTTGLTRVSCWFTRDTVEELDFDEWRDKKESYPQRIYRNSDGYLIRSKLWESLDEEMQDSIRNQSKNITESGSEFWEYYGSYVE